jgi:hypothetical protein
LHIFQLSNKQADPSSPQKTKQTGVRAPANHERREQKEKNKKNSECNFVEHAKYITRVSTYSHHNQKTMVCTHTTAATITTSLYAMVYKLGRYCFGKKLAIHDAEGRTNATLKVAQNNYIST